MIARSPLVRSPLPSLNQPAVPSLLPLPPGWVAPLLGLDSIEQAARADEVSVIAADHLSLYSTVVCRAVSLSAGALRARVRESYISIAEALSRDRRQPIRFWNFVPSPGEPMDGMVDRYMVFNAGRYDAYEQWYGTPRAFSHSLATASAVGVASDDYVLYCLASDTAGIPVENPRQTSSWRYSVRYGPKPPCFARATIADIAGARRLLIGGTASIVGEESVHVGSAAAQVQETLRNMAALIATARGTADESGPASLARMTHVRIYIREAGDAATILGGIEPHCHADATIEAAISDVCRPELLVEVEAIADL